MSRSSVEGLFIVPVRNKFLIYSPLHNLIALVDKLSVDYLRANLQSNTVLPGNLMPIMERLQSRGIDPPRSRTTKLTDPLFLGIIPTRGCNLSCRYCSFPAPKQNSSAMSLKMARKAVDAYLDLLTSAGKRRAEIHFFGGEPFFAPEVVQFVVEYVNLRASELGLDVHFEAITNGMFNSTCAEWIADYFDTIILSLDGPRDIQERQRPALNGQSTFETIIRNAKIFSEGQVELIIRVCVTNKNVAQLAKTADWLAQEFNPSTICFEPLTESPLSLASGLYPPSPWEFAERFIDAMRTLQNYGIETIFSSTNLKDIQTSFCPVGKDALIVSPDGDLNGCYLLPDDWSRHGLDFRFGKLAPTGLDIDYQSLQRIRNLSIQTKTLCVDCLCRYHCAGGCHVNHDTSKVAGEYDDFCIQTRSITIAKLLSQIKQDGLVEEWLGDRPGLEKSILQQTDLLFSEEFTL